MKKANKVEKIKVKVDDEFVEKYGVEIFRLQGEGKKIKTIAKLLNFEQSVIIDFFEYTGKRCCRQCKEIKDFKKTKINIRCSRVVCKICYKEYYQKNKEEIKGKRKEYYQENKEEIKEQKNQS